MRSTSNPARNNKTVSTPLDLSSFARLKANQFSGFETTRVRHRTQFPALVARFGLLPANRDRLLWALPIRWPAFQFAHDYFIVRRTDKGEYTRLVNNTYQTHWKLVQGLENAAHRRPPVHVHAVPRDATAGCRAKKTRTIPFLPAFDTHISFRMHLSPL